MTFWLAKIFLFESKIYKKNQIMTFNLKKKYFRFFAIFLRKSRFNIFQVPGIRDQGSDIRDHGSWIRDQGSGNRDQGSGNREQKTEPKGTNFKVQSIAIANPLDIELLHQWPGWLPLWAKTIGGCHSEQCRLYPATL